MHVSKVSSELRRMSEPLELEMGMAVTCPTWVLGSKLGSSARADRDRNLWVISLDPDICEIFAY